MPYPASLNPNSESHTEIAGTLELPGSRALRIQGYDVARGLAFIGMVLVNFEIVFTAAGAQSSIFMEFFAGRASALFVLLAGVGISLMTRGAIQKDPLSGLRKVRWIYLKRAAFLLVIGYAWQPLWEADILHYYAFYIGIAALFLTVDSVALWVMALLSVAIFGFIFSWIPYTEGWNFKTYSHPDFWTWGGQLKNLLYNGWHPLFPWLSFVFVGLWIGRLNARRLSVQLSLIGSGIAAIVIAYLLMLWLQPSVTLFDGMDGIFEAAFWDTESIPPGPLYVLSATGSAVAVIGICLLVVPWLGRLATPLVRTGQMALTLYLAHVLLGIGPFVGSNEEAAAMAWPNPSIVWFWISFSIGSIIFATLWLHWFRRGPLEWVMRKLCG
ncbi:MAG: DUF418 domain-containing protein [Phycisphaerales bacterium]|nr:DUF418 domain-containing protein [Phycisphaerales bacterium]